MSLDINPPHRDANARLAIKSLDTDHKRVTLQTECFVGTCKVIDGEAMVLFHG